jgi:two-component system, chemotaxis family, CheB/CheR fusion protein
LRVTRELRDIVLFAKHSLLKDPPFSRVDLISCRNLLIYLDRELQQQVCATFHFALNSPGYLFLGSSESADNPIGMFRIIDREARLYQRMSISSGCASRRGPKSWPLDISPCRHEQPPCLVRRLTRRFIVKLWNASRRRA